MMLANLLADEFYRLVFHIKKGFVLFYILSLSQGITLVLGGHFEGDGVCGKLRANERSGRATSQRYSS